MITIEKILDLIDRSTEPDVMSKHNAHKFLEILSSRLDSRMEALREEMKEDEAG